MTLLADLCYVVRGLWRDRLPTLWAVLVLALGIGATAAVFGVVNATLLQPLPYKEPDRLAVLWQTDMRFSHGIIPWGNFLDYQRQTQIFRGVAAFSYWAPVLVKGSGRERIIGASCTPDLFTLLGTSPLLGRTFLPQEQGHGVNHVIILSYGLWQRDFDSDAGVIGKHAVLDNFGSPTEYTIVGVMRPGFDFPHPFFEQRIQAWVPLGLDQVDASRRGNQVYALARLRTGVTLAEAQSELSRVAGRLAQEYPSTNQGVGVRLVPLGEQLVHNTKPLLLTLLAAVGFIVLLACTSIAGLILAHGVRASHASALRVVLGASEWDLMRPLLIEGLVLATSGGTLGVVVAQSVLTAGLSRIPADLLGPRWSEPRVDGTVLAFGLALALICGVGAALIAALRLCRLSPVETLKRGARSISTSEAGIRLQIMFVAIEIAVAFVLLAGTGLMIRSFLRLDHQRLGFDTNNLLTFHVSLPNSLARGDREVPVLNRFLDRVRALPGVESADIVDSFPFNGYPYKFRVEGGTSRWNVAEFHTVSPGWLDTLGLRLVAGRTFAHRDNGKARRVMIVNQQMVRRFWPGENPLGKLITVEPSRWSPAPQYTVIGEVSDVRPFGGGHASPAMFVSFSQFAEPDCSVVVRATVGPESLIGPLRELTFETNTAALAERFTTAKKILAHSTRKPYLVAMLLGALAVLAFTVAAIGTYSVVSLLLQSQMRSVGVRLALGAQRRSIVIWFLKAGLHPTLLGVAIGLGTSLWLDRLMTSLLYGLSPSDPTALTAAALVMIGVCLLATLPTALKAAKVNPSQILKDE